MLDLETRDRGIVSRSRFLFFYLLFFFCKIEIYVCLIVCLSDHKVLTSSIAMLEIFCQIFFLWPSQKSLHILPEENN